MNSLPYMCWKLYAFGLWTFGKWNLKNECVGVFRGLVEVAWCLSINSHIIIMVHHGSHLKIIRKHVFLHLDHPKARLLPSSEWPKHHHNKLQELYLNS